MQSPPADLNNSAIQASLSKNWQLAIKLNQQILRTDPRNTDALNRLAKAFLYSGFKTKSEAAYKKVLKLDKFNSIALKGLENLKTYKVERKKDSLASVDYSSAFLEEPGTTRSVNLIRLGDISILARLQPGDEVRLQAREHCISVCNTDQEYLGRLPDDISSRLRPMMKSGNTYQAWVKTLSVHRNNLAKSMIKIFIREVTRSAKFKHLPSFPSTEKLSYAAFTPPELVHQDRPRTTSPEEEDAEEITAGDQSDTDTEPDSSQSE